MAPLFRDLAGLPAGPERTAVRDALVTGHLPIAQHIAQRFANRGEPQPDLVQVATVGLINAVDRFDPERGSDFLSFAIPTVMGEVRRHFRDTGWAVRVPRRLKELHLALNRAAAELSQVSGRSATPSELARHLDIPVEQVNEGLEAGSGYQSQSLDSILALDQDSTPLGDRIGALDRAFEEVEVHQTLRPLLDKLPDRERRILLLRFYGNMTQSQIAEQVGLSQMHVSRLLSKVLARLREELRD